MKAAGKKNQEEHNLFIKNEPVTPNLAAQNRGFVWVPAVPSVTFGAALLHAAAPGPHPGPSAALSHIPAQAFTHLR